MKMSKLLLAFMLGMAAVSFAPLSMGKGVGGKGEAGKIYLVFRFKLVAVKTVSAIGGPTPYVDVHGTLHLHAETLFAEDGSVSGFRVFGNLSDTTARAVDDGRSFRVVGSAEGVPAECAENAACPPPSWTLMFRLVPTGSGGPRSSILVFLKVDTVYDADGNMIAACLQTDDRRCVTGEVVSHGD